MGWGVPKFAKKCWFSFKKIYIKLTIYKTNSDFTGNLSKNSKNCCFNIIICANMYFGLKNVFNNLLFEKMTKGGLKITFSSSATIFLVQNQKYFGFVL